MQLRTPVFAALALGLAARAVAGPVAYVADRRVDTAAFDGTFRRALPLGERLFVEIGERSVAVVDPRYSRVDWRRDLDAPVRGTALRGETAVVAADHLYGFDADNGAFAWVWPLTSQRLLQLADDVAVVAISDAAGERVNLIDLDTGEPIWPEWADAPGAMRADVGPDTVFVEVGRGRGWRVPVGRVISRTPGYVAATYLADLPPRPTASLGMRRDAGWLVTSDDGAGWAVVDAPARVERVGEALVVVGAGAVQTLRPTRLTAALLDCAKQLEDGDRACLDRIVPMAHTVPHVRGALAGTARQLVRLGRDGVLPGPVVADDLAAVLSVLDGCDGSLAPLLELAAAYAREIDSAALASVVAAVRRGPASCPAQARALPGEAS